MKRSSEVRIGEIYEIVLSTYNDDGRPNAAPMGIAFTNRKRVLVRLHKGSRTLANVLSRRCAVVNLTSDPVLFYRTAFKGETKLPNFLFSKARMVNAPLLKDADGYLELSLIRSIPEKEKVNAEFSIRRSSCGQPPHLYSRAPHALLEATVHATRVREYLSRGKRRKAAPLIRMINHYKDVIERVSPDSDYARAIKELQSNINRRKRETQSTRKNPV